MDTTINGVIRQSYRHMIHVKNFVSLTTDTITINKSEVISNILLGIPNPPIYVIEDINGNLTSINDNWGNLICNTIVEFTAGKFPLKCDILNINGYYNEILPKYCDILDNLRVNIISIIYYINPVLLERIKKQITINYEMATHNIG